MSDDQKQMFKFGKWLMAIMVLIQAYMLYIDHGDLINQRVQASLVYYSEVFKFVQSLLTNVKDIRMVLVIVWGISGVLLLCARKVGALATMLATIMMVAVHSNVWTNKGFKDDDFSNLCKMGVVFASAVLIFRHNA